MNTTSATEPVGWVPDAPPHPPVTRVDEARVAAFVAAHKLEDWVELAVRLARESFPGARAIKVSMVGGPDDEEYGERLWVEAMTEAGADESYRQYRECVDRWLAATPPWVTERMNVGSEAA